MINASELTVLVPTYNRLSLLKNCLASLEKQTAQNFKIFIIDNDSTDGTKEYLKTLTELKPNVYTFSQNRNVGLFNNLLDGINRINSKYISILSDDDSYDPYAVERLLEAIDSDPNVRIAFSSHNLMSFDGEINLQDSKKMNHKYGRTTNLPNFLENRFFLKLHLQKKIVCMGSAIFLTKQLKEAARIEAHGLDYTLISQYIILGGNGRFLPISLMNYRINPNGASQSFGSSIPFSNYVISACNLFLKQNYLDPDEKKFIYFEIFCYKYSLFKEFNLNALDFLRTIKYQFLFRDPHLLISIPFHFLRVLFIRIL